MEQGLFFPNNKKGQNPQPSYRHSCVKEVQTFYNHQIIKLSHAKWFHVKVEHSPTNTLQREIYPLFFIAISKTVTMVHLNLA